MVISKIIHNFAARNLNNENDNDNENRLKMTSKEKIKAEVENRIKEHKKQLRRKDLTVVSEAAMKGSLGAYESLLNFIINMPACETTNCYRFKLEK